MALINRDTDYAVRALVLLAGRGGVVPVSVLAEDQRVPEHFLRKIMQKLHRAGIVRSRQGAAGGYELALPSGEVSLRRVIEVIQGPVIVNACLADPDMCVHRRKCPVRPALVSLQEEIEARLDGLRLGDVVSHSEKERPEAVR